MIRRSFRIGLWLGLLGGLTYAVLRLVQGDKQGAVPPGKAAPSPQPWKRLEVDETAATPASPAAPSPADAVAEIVAPQPRPEPVLPPTPAAAPAKKEPARKEPAKKVAAKKAAPKKVLAPWVDPKGGICPKAHPVKAKLGSKIFQVPGQFAYDRTFPDRCYKDPATAEKDGFRAAKR